MLVMLWIVICRFRKDSWVTSNGDKGDVCVRLISTDSSWLYRADSSFFSFDTQLNLVGTWMRQYLNAVDFRRLVSNIRWYIDGKQANIRATTFPTSHLTRRGSCRSSAGPHISLEERYIQQKDGSLRASMGPTPPILHGWLADWRVSLAYPWMTTWLGCGAVSKRNSGSIVMGDYFCGLVLFPQNKHILWKISGRDAPP